MANTVLRELERQFRESNTGEDERAWLREAVRQGELKLEELRLLARLGNASAQALVRLDGDLASQEAFKDWLTVFLRSARMKVILGAVEAITIAADAYYRYNQRDSSIEQAVQACRSWINTPAGENALAVKQARDAAKAALEAAAEDAICPYDDLPSQRAEGAVAAARAVLATCELILDPTFGPEKISEKIFRAAADAVSYQKQGGMTVLGASRLSYIIEAISSMRGPLIMGITNGVCG